MKKFIYFILIIAVSACSINKQSLGLGRQDPDEFTVIKRQPLSLPPNYNITPPEPGKEALKTVNPEREAEKTLFGSTSQNNSISEEDKSFLKSINADLSKQDIRKTLEEETTKDPSNDKNIVNNLMFWKEKDNSVVVDNLQEAKRIKENTENGISIDNGDVPIISPKN